MSGAKILIVDDELIVRESLGGWLERDGHTVDKAASGEEALEKCEKTRYDILLLDIKMEGMSGLEVLKKVKENDPDVSVVMITAYGSIPSAIEAMKSGAYEYMLKPFDPDELIVLIEKIRKHQAETRETQFLREQYKERTRFENMIGQSGSLQAVFDLIERIAPTDSTVLIKGETGTGKGLAARAIHTQSGAVRDRLWWSTAVPSRNTSSKANSSDIKRALSRTRRPRRKAGWSWRTGEPCCWTRLERSARGCKSISFGSWRTTSSIVWEEPSPSKRTFVSSRQRTRTWKRPSKTERSVKISTIVSM